MASVVVLNLLGTKPAGGRFRFGLGERGLEPVTSTTIR